MKNTNTAQINPELVSVKTFLAVGVILVCTTIAGLMSQYAHDTTIAKIDRGLRRLSDTSYLIEGDTNKPMYARAYYDLREEIMKQPDFFRENYGASAKVSLVMASDIVDNTQYLQDFRCDKSLKYTEAYFDYYEDELARLEEAYFKDEGIFRPQYLMPTNTYADPPETTTPYWYWLP